MKGSQNTHLLSSSTPFLTSYTHHLPFDSLLSSQVKKKEEVIVVEGVVGGTPKGTKIVFDDNGEEVEKGESELAKNDVVGEAQDDDESKSDDDSSSSSSSRDGSDSDSDSD